MRCAVLEEGVPSTKKMRPSVEGPLRRRVYPSHGPSSFPQALPPSFSQDSTSPSGAVSVTVFSVPHSGHLNRRRSAGWTCSVLRARRSSRPTSSMRCPHLSHGLSIAIRASLWLPRQGVAAAHRGAAISEPTAWDRRRPLFRLTRPSPLRHRPEPNPNRNLWLGAHRTAGDTSRGAESRRRRAGQLNRRGLFWGVCARPGVATRARTSVAIRHCS